MHVRTREKFVTAQHRSTRVTYGREVNQIVFSNLSDQHVTLYATRGCRTQSMTLVLLTCMRVQHDSDVGI